MSFVSATDVVGAIRLGWNIYDMYFRRINRADERYMEFGRDIRRLSRQLELLRDVFQRAHEMTRQTPYGSDNDLLTEGQKLVGDFSTTIKYCQKLLQENQDKASGSFAHTIRWYTAGLETQSQSLKERIQFHCARINFLLQPLELELLSGIDRGIANLRRGQSQILRIITSPEVESLDTLPTRTDRYDLVEVPPNLASRYEEQARKFCTSTSGEDISLGDSLKALIYHFSMSTYQGGGGGAFDNFSLSQYNALIKSRWLLGRILDSSAFRGLQSGLSLTVIERITDEIRSQYSRFQENWDLEVAEQIATFDESHFRIWVEDRIEPLVPAVTEEGPGETKILEIALPPRGYTQQSLLVFRQTKTEYRLLRISRGDGANMEQSVEKQIVNIHSFRFVPYYAVPGFESKSVQICHSDVHRGDIFDMETEADLFSFQRALTGYRVAFATKAHWGIERGTLWNKRLDGEGESSLQIWEWDPPARAGGVQDATESGDGEAYYQESNPDAKSTPCASMVASCSREVAAVLAASNGRSVQNGVIASSAPKVPILILCTNIGGELSFLHLRLQTGMVINPERCGCRLNTSDCRESFLERNPRKKGKFKMHKFSAPNKDGQPVLADWNLLLFCQPPHPNLKSATTSITKISRLHLELKTSEDRLRFQKAFAEVRGRYESLRAQFDNFGAAMRVLDHRPQNLAVCSSGFAKVDSISESRLADHPRRVSDLSHSDGTSMGPALQGDRVSSSSRLGANLASSQIHLSPPACRSSASDSAIDDSSLNKAFTCQLDGQNSQNLQPSMPQPGDRFSFTSLSGTRSRHNEATVPGQPAPRALSLGRRSNSMGAANPAAIVPQRRALTTSVRTPVERETSSVFQLTTSERQRSSRTMGVAPETLQEDEELDFAESGNELEGERGFGIQTNNLGRRDESFETGTLVDPRISRSSTHTLVDSLAERTDPRTSVVSNGATKGKQPAMAQNDEDNEGGDEEIVPMQAQTGEIAAKLASDEHEKQTVVSRDRRRGSGIVPLRIN